jgi:hypothetical protein
MPSGGINMKRGNKKGGKCEVNTGKDKRQSGNIN